MCGCVPPDEPLKKPVPIYEQTVKDEKGRYQRFHGAFTGGFSAGYFNTVGTKEGWTPSTFKSSREDKFDQQRARPEDFMDEEDFGEHGIAPREITRSAEFQSGHRKEASEKARAVNAQSSLIPGDTLLEEIIAPAKSSIGVELLKTMGWREGQGVGPRVKRKPRKQRTEESLRVYGCALPSRGSEGSEEDDDDDEFAPENVTFAPKDVTPVDFTPHLGLQGLGYRGLDPGLALGQGAEHINLFDPQFDSKVKLFGGKQKQSRRRGVAGQGFGVGALEDEDEDIYQRDSISKYDTEIKEEEPTDGLFGWTAPQEYTKKKAANRDAAYLGKILEGFTLAQKSEALKSTFPPPRLPRDYRPVRRFNPGTFVSHVSGVSPALAQALKTSRGHMVKDEPQTGRHQLDSGQRRTLIGEEALEGPSSVMDLLKPADRERLKHIRKSRSEPQSHPSKDSSSHNAMRPPSPTLAPFSKPPSVTAPPSVCLMQQQEALSAWRGQTSTQAFKPFDKNPEKQERYEKYLNCLREGHTDALDQSVDSEMTEWERSREKEEFVRASILYRPSSSFLSSRFTRGKQDDEETVEVNRDEEGDLDDKQAAVKMKMFGKLTRETFEWHPDKLLCKRFNVPDPFPGSGLVGLPQVKRDKYSVFNFLTVPESKEPPAPLKPPEVKKSRWDMSQEMKNSDAPSETNPDNSEDQNRTTDESRTAETLALPAPDTKDTKTETKEKSSRESDSDSSDSDSDSVAEEETRPPMDVFKAIFSCSSDEKSSSENEEEEKEEPEHITHNLFNIDISALPAPAVATPPSAPINRNTAHSAQDKTRDEQDCFGPKLPPPSSTLSRSTGLRPRSRSPSPGEKSKKSKDKKNKNKKEHKHKKEKKKKKHKKHKHKGKEKKSRKDESSSESDSDENAAEVSTEELLRRLKTVRSQCPL
ncbi:unnamed protein product [Knipowitschia caucasica]